jgi:hypothetical protein
MKYRRAVALCAVLTIAPSPLPASPDGLWPALAGAFAKFLRYVYQVQAKSMDSTWNCECHIGARGRAETSLLNRPPKRYRPRSRSLSWLGSRFNPRQRALRSSSGETDGTYISLQFGLTSPYSVLSPTSEAAQWFSGGLKSLVDAPAGPSGTGLQSQVCSISELDSDGSEVIACAGNNSVGVSCEQRLLRGF